MRHLPRHETIPAPEVLEYHGEVPTAFADLTAFSPLAEMRGVAAAVAAADKPRAPAAQPTPSVATWMAANRTPVAPSLDLEQLEQFKTLMAANHWPVHVARMLFDLQYAYDRIVLAHTSRNYQLRTLALNLFKIYQSRGKTH